jgi:hypothetical protein
MQMEAELSGEGFGVDAEVVVVAALFEGDEDLVSNGAAEDLPYQVIFRLLSAGMGTREGMEGSARERQSAQRQRTFQVRILVTRLNLMS